METYFRSTLLRMNDFLAAMSYRPPCRYRDTDSLLALNKEWTLRAKKEDITFVFLCYEFR